MDDRSRFAELMRPFQEAARDPLETVRRWKAATGGRAVGCVGLHVPEEVISAAGMLPVLLLEKQGPILHADSHVQNNMCGYIRSLADQALSGELRGLDSLVILDSCHVIRMIGDSLRHSAADQVARIDFLFFPVSLERTEAPAYLLKELASFATRMEAVAGKAITPQDLAEAIRRHNVNRRQLQRLYQLRRQTPGLIGALEVATIVKASMCLPKGDHSALLAPLLEELERQSAGSPSASAGTPVIVSGSLCESCDEILAELEASGATIVDDDLFVGSRYFATLVGEEAPGLEALADAYINKVTPCPTVHRRGKDLGAYLGDMAQQANAQGVVTVVVKYCEPHYYGYLMQRRKLRERAIPQYMVEKEREAASQGQIKTRLQAFLEGIEVEASA